MEMPFQTHNPRQNDKWTEERIALMLRLDAENILSRGLIADELRKQTGARFTRNAVIGKFLRLGVPRKKGRAPKKTRPWGGFRRSQKKFKPKAVPKVRHQPVEILDSLKLSLEQLTNTACRYITSRIDEPVEY